MKPRIIKAGQPVRLSPIETPLEDARKAATRMVAEAHAQAAALTGQAQADAARLRAQAVTDGREAGIAEVAELYAGTRAWSERARREAEPELRKLAVKIAEKILGRELALRPEAVADVALEALRSAGEPEQLLIRAHPDDVAALERERPRLMERLRDDGVIAVRADAQVARGGCVLETPLGVVDARLATQLQAIERALTREST